jgi:hypothetical protein
MEKEKRILIRKNNPELVKQLIELGYKASEFCNEGCFIEIVDKKYLFVYHEPFKSFIDCGIDDQLFIQKAKELK